MDRIRRLAAQVKASDDHEQDNKQQLQSLLPSPVAGMSLPEKSDDDVVICSALRTAITRAKRGAFKDACPDELLSPLFRATLERTGLAPEDVGDVVIGNVNQPGAGEISSRMAEIAAGLPCTVPLSTVNRQCSSGLEAVANVASAILAGVIDVGIAGGVECMSQFGIALGDANKISPNVIDDDLAISVVTPMGLTSENVAEKYGITRERQDAMAVDSHRKAIAAQKAGLFKDEIVPVTVKVKADKSSEARDVVVEVDEGPRADTSAKGLAALRPAFKVGGSSTAGNSSQVSDGAAMVLLARRAVAKRLGLPVLARLRSYAVVGVDPRYMGIGPAYAVPAALEKAGIKLEDVDIFEINEAFASQATFCVDHLGIPVEKLNPKGGAIALGHPLGCTGSRQIATLLPELKRQGKRLGVVSMCMGTGMGAAAVIESEQ